jgi:hypothetical protein
MKMEHDKDKVTQLSEKPVATPSFSSLPIVMIGALLGTALLMATAIAATR